MKILVEVTVDAAIEEVWDAYTSPEDIQLWNFASEDWHCPSATVDLRVGGVFSSRMEAKDGSAGFDFAGTYTQIIDRELIEYSFGDRLARVTFSQEPEGVKVSVSFDTEDENSFEQQRLGWQAILDNFAHHVLSKYEDK
jgi:uncharacterized protein YndB with AHSA1/START domain